MGVQGHVLVQGLELGTRIWKQHLPLQIYLLPLSAIQSNIDLRSAVLDAPNRGLEITPRSAKLILSEMDHQIQPSRACATMHSYPLALLLVECC